MAKSVPVFVSYSGLGQKSMWLQCYNGKHNPSEVKLSRVSKKKKIKTGENGFFFTLKLNPVGHCSPLSFKVTVGEVCARKKISLFWVFSLTWFVENLLLTGIWHEISTFQKLRWEWQQTAIKAGSQINRGNFMLNASYYIVIWHLTWNFPR